MNKGNPYNGWKNYQTWNVALFIGNDRYYYDIAKKSKDYREFIKLCPDKKTPDGVSFRARSLDIGELDKMIMELSGGRR